MTHAQAIETLLQKADELLAQGEKRKVAVLLDKILRLDFKNPRTWQMLHQMLSPSQPLEVFQRDFAQKYYPARAHFLEPLDLIPPVPAEVTPITPFVAPPPAEEVAPESTPQPSISQPYSTPIKGIEIETSQPVAQTEAKKEKGDEAVLCPACGMLNRTGARFCAMCGSNLSLAEEPIPTSPPQAPTPAPPVIILQPNEPVPTLPVILQPDEPVPTVSTSTPPPSRAVEEVICPNCGRANPQDARLCAYCGYDFFYRQVVSKEKPHFRFHFVDLGDFVVLASLLLPWASIFRNTFLGNSTQKYDAFGVIADFGGGANINIAVILFFLLGIGASILVRARQKLLALIAAIGSLAAQIYALTTMQSISGQAAGQAGMFFDLSSITVREGAIVGLVGAILILLGVIFYEGGIVGGIWNFLKSAWKAILIVMTTLFLLVAVIIINTNLKSQARSNQSSTQMARTYLPKTQTSFLKTETAVATTPQAGVDLKKYQIVYAGSEASAGASTAVLTANGDGSDQHLVYHFDYDLLGAFVLLDRRTIIVYGIGRVKNHGQYGIWMVRSDGSHARMLAEGEVPVLSPDGRLLAYLHDNAIWLMGSDGSKPHRLVDGTDRSWSPDSRALVFSNPNDQYQLYRINIDGSGLMKLMLNSDTGQSDPIWSPDGKTILYTSTCAKDLACLYALDINSGNVKQLTNPKNGSVNYIVLSPDGQKTLFRVYANNVNNLYVVDVNTVKVLSVASSNEILFPVWSPDGKWILYGTREALFAVQPGSAPVWIRLMGIALMGTFMP